MSAMTTARVFEVGHLYEVAPGELTIGSNVRADIRADAKEFAASVRARGVLVAIDAHVDAGGALVVLRGQRRALVAAQVGTPSGRVPVRVVPAPDEADRITDQLVENLHRAGMRERETREAVEQLALLGVPVAQIVKRTALARPVVAAALAVSGHEASKARMDAQDMTLEQAAVFAEFEDDPDAVAALEQAWDNPWQRDRLAHVAQRLRDERAERQALRRDVERLRAEGLPVLDPDDVPANASRLELADLLDQDGQPVPAEQWPTTTGAAVIVTVQWQDPDDQNDTNAPEDEEGPEEAEPRQVYVPVWICTDPPAAGLRHRWDRLGTTAQRDDEPEDEQERERVEQERREAESAERRRVLANNAAWRSAETVRRQWLTGLLARRQVPKGAEALIARSILERAHPLVYAMSNGHDLLADLLNLTVPSGGYQASAHLAERALAHASTPAAATLRTLAAVLAAWEARTGVHTWRNPGPYDAAIMTALIGWGYTPSDVEHLLIPEMPDAEPDTAA